jgi:hypothetical protein
MIDNARDIVARTAAIIYSWNDVVEPANWWTAPTAANITALRCDGFVEVAQEMTDIMVWGHRTAPDTYNFDIRASQQAQDEHNGGEIAKCFWEKYLFPATQCAHESTYRFTHWNTRLSRVNAASLRPYEPVFP